MSDTRERILQTALRLFAAEGYEAVSVSDIAGELGITKGALYRHYRSKRDIFDSILARMEQNDAAQAQAHDLPEGPAEEAEAAYRTASVGDIVAFSKAMFRYWTQDEFAARFRRLLTLEQYRSAEMGRLYQQYLASGPLDYVTELFAGLGIPRPREEAMGLYAPMFLMYGVYDGAADGAAVVRETDALLDEAGIRLTEQLEKGREKP